MIEPSLMHYSPEFETFLSLALPGIEVHKLAGDAGSWMPLAVTKHRLLGTVINSLPFFGSHGGPVTGGDQVNGRALMETFASFVADSGALSATVIENPFEPLDEPQVAASSLQAVDDRISQVTHLPWDAPDIEAALLEKLHVKSRNAVRKGRKLPLRIELRNDAPAWEWMQRVHEDSIRGLGGIPKSMSTFNALQQSFGSAARLHVASMDGKPVAGLVTVCYRSAIEYFTPVVEPEYRHTQALSALIFAVMLDGTALGFRLWNWGGTWRSQEGVYRFKHRWGAEDRPYRYLNRVCRPSLLAESKDRLAASFPSFYLYRY